MQVFNIGYNHLIVDKLIKKSRFVTKISEYVNNICILPCIFGLIVED